MMIKRTLITLIILLAFSFIKANAGWYECYNFSGTIGKSPITLFIQMREGYFGEKDKKDFNVIGVYKYDRIRAPVRLEGKRNLSNNKIVLYEVTSKKQTATFEFDFSESESVGFWKNLLTDQKLPLNLKYVSKLTDTTAENQFTNVEILQADSLKDFYFIGVYSKNKNQADAEMTELKIIRKKDDTLFQTLNFYKVTTATGNLMTVIFDNVQANNKSKNFIISNKVGRVGGYLTVNYSLKKKRFVLNPKPIIEGPD
jgi:hypothetical protein